MERPLSTTRAGPFLFAGAILRRTETFLTNKSDFGIDLSTGVCVRGVGHMPGDPKQCHEHAKRCWALASEITNPVLKQSLLDAAQRWTVLAAELATIHSLLDALEEPEKKAVGRDFSPSLTGSHSSSARGGSNTRMEPN
jgi:hypothetical protein